MTLVRCRTTRPKVASITLFLLVGSAPACCCAACRPEPCSCCPGSLPDTAVSDSKPLAPVLLLGVCCTPETLPAAAADVFVGDVIDVISAAVLPVATLAGSLLVGRAVPRGWMGGWAD